MKNKIIFIVVTLIMYSGYQLTSRFQLTEPTVLPQTAFDKSIPFLIWTVWPYLILAAFAFLPILLRDKFLIIRAAFAIIIAVGINTIIYFIFPTIINRAASPEVTDLSTFAYNWLCNIDTPNNCLPSGHITNACIGFWALAKENKKYSILLWIIFALLGFTIFTTKQHYFWDLPAGLATAFTGITLSKFAYNKFNQTRIPV